MLEPLFVAIIAGVIGVGLQEYYHLAQKTGSQPLTTAGIFCSTTYVFAVYLSTQTPLWSELPNIVLAFSFVAVFFHFFYKDSRPLVNLPVTAFGIIWITLTLAGFVRIVFQFPLEGTEDGRWWFIYLLVITKMNDAGAYFIGKFMGKRKLAPKLSPQKTIEGAIGGMAFALLSSLGFFLYTAWIADVPPITLLFTEAVGLALALSVAGTIGDLAESLMKRDAGVKDSSALPGLGGVLDVVDSLLFTTPILTLFLSTVKL